MMDWGGVLLGEQNDLSEGAKKAIVESITHAPAPEKERTAQELMDGAEKAVDFVSRVAPKAKSLFDLLRSKQPTTPSPKEPEKT